MPGPGGRWPSSRPRRRTGSAIGGRRSDRSGRGSSMPRARVPAMGRLGEALRVRRGEGRTVALTVGTMAVASAGFAIGQSGIDGLFFSRYGVENLPILYLIQGPLMFAASLGATGALARLDRRRAFTLAPLGLAGLLVVERVAAATGVSLILPALWLSVSIALLVQSLFTWGIAGLVTDTRQAKRLFPLFGAGTIAGAVLGGLVTKPLAAAIGASNLLLVWAALLVASAALGAAAVPRRSTRLRGARRRAVRRASAAGGPPRAPAGSAIGARRVAGGRGRLLLGPVLLGVPALLGGGGEPLPERRGARRVLRRVLRRDDRGGPPDLGRDREPASVADRRRGGRRAPGARLRRGVRGADRHRGVPGDRGVPVRADGAGAGARVPRVGGARQRRAAIATRPDPSVPERRAHPRGDEARGGPPARRRACVVPLDRRGDRPRRRGAHGGALDPGPALVHLSGGRGSPRGTSAGVRTADRGTVRRTGPRSARSAIHPRGRGARGPQGPPRRGAHSRRDRLARGGRGLDPSHAGRGPRDPRSSAARSRRGGRRSSPGAAARSRGRGPARGRVDPARDRSRRRCGGRGPGAAVERRSH